MSSATNDSRCAGKDRMVLRELVCQLLSGSISFSELSPNYPPPEKYCNLTEDDVRFAVATLGVKINRKGYRTPFESRTHPCIGKCPNDKLLIDACVRHSKVQNEVRPLSAVGSYNLAWCSNEKKDWKSAHEWFKESLKELILLAKIFFELLLGSN